MKFGLGSLGLAVALIPIASALYRVDDYETYVPTTVGPHPTGAIEPAEDQVDIKVEPTVYSQLLDEFENVLGESDGMVNHDNLASIWMSFSMIVVSEIGDKTFLIAALMAMRSPRWLVFAGASSALVVMTVLSCIVGHILPTLLTEKTTKTLASILFVVFGIKLAKEGFETPKDVGVEEELAEVEEEIALSSINNKLDDAETGSVSGSNKKKYQTTLSHLLEETKELLSFILSPTFLQVFTMTFLGEWGDRSQIATIAMAASAQFYFVIVGSVLGHALCTGIAVLGGKLLAGHISLRAVNLGGSLAFFIFAFIYLYEIYM
ncbi:Protein of unknown function involved in calcium homeostasis [Komagataella phaffii CBS 7435]|uniref:GDT1 family protein n=2 Tax=Komagataella phaffii TaxID=460519 RepID=C4R2Z7_KOMPG|nr:uncharacterized protein PAS_chr2-2_0062 [Komagataella phaffii GS115]AOA62783.1 GQ67_01288T0 [Komagataella phaffii]CAH2447572.1 Protein of unknown function involved in calcium homeostasis [Komagataella phaffii CBS 7435]AOA68145.1 GQ68_00102T0 [Komagataella phaffii GS115]CAY69871.1 Putative protein of unknown function [Komagataella phaffii GS115]CCA37763.1 Protein of unknown function involved in calcium homeostasis [Komagataella phaffii CBS 7435]